MLLHLHFSVSILNSGILFIIVTLGFSVDRPIIQIQEIPIEREERNERCSGKEEEKGEGRMEGEKEKERERR